jgi:hypothetical protein
VKQHPELVFAGRATSAWSRDIGGAISNTLNGYFRFPRWISCSTVIFWYIANLAVGAFAVALIGIWLAGIVAILAAQIVVFIVALPFAAVYAGQEQKRQRKLERHNYVVYLVEKYIEQTGDEQVDHDAFNDWVIEQEDK